MRAADACLCLFAFFAPLCHSEPRCRQQKVFQKASGLQAGFQSHVLQSRFASEVIYGPYL